MMHSVANRNDVLEAGTCEKILKTMSINSAFCRIYKTMVWKWELLLTFWKWGRLMLHSSAIWNDVLEVETAEKIKNKQVA